MIRMTRAEAKQHGLRTFPWLSVLKLQIISHANRQRVAARKVSRPKGE